jgi:hypothetical protein
MNGNATNARPGIQARSTGQEIGPYYAHHDFDGPAKLSTTLIHTLSEVASIDATDTESSLFQHVDPDALDRIFKPVSPEAPRANGHVSFVVWGYNVTVYSNGQIVISPPQQPTPDNRPRH